MIVIKTELSIDHIELMKIFVKANELVGMVIKEHENDIRGVKHKVIHIECHSKDTEEKLTFMSLRHAGIQNMFDDYLLRCGVGVTELQPGTMRRQVHDEWEKDQNEKFMKQFSNTKEQNEHFNK